jgi:hypothetical protein
MSYAHLKNVRVSENFTAHEAVHSENYPHLVEIPTAEIMYHIAAFAGAVLEPIRAHAFEGRPVSVNSWYRNPRLNKAVGGVSTSIHKMYCSAGKFMGVATDITGDIDLDLVIARMADPAFLRKVPMLKKIIYYPSRKFIHVNSYVSLVAPVSFQLSLTKGNYEPISQLEAADIKNTLKTKFKYGG